MIVIITILLKLFLWRLALCATCNSSSLHGCSVYDCVWMGTRMIVLGSNMRVSSGPNGPCFGDRDVLPEEVSGPHTFEMINLIYFLHYTTVHYPVLTIRWLYTLSHSLTHSLIIFFTCCFLTSPSIRSAPSELSFYIHSDDVMLPEPSVSRSFSHFPCCFKGRECSGSFFTWLVGWVTDTPRLLS
jgi:hypothetical protein